MMFYGYHRVSTKEQNLERGIKGIEDFCKSRNYKLEKVFVDKMSGKTVDRPRKLNQNLSKCLEIIRQQQMGKTA